MEEQIIAAIEEAAVKTPQGLNSKSRSLCETSQGSGASGQKIDPVSSAKPGMVQKKAFIRQMGVQQQTGTSDRVWSCT